MVEVFKCLFGQSSAGQASVSLQSWYSESERSESHKFVFTEK